ncbi:MAG TPA: glucose-6-phosphate isomerase [Gammaproteobacteria bacterium]
MNPGRGNKSDRHATWQALAEHRATASLEMRDMFARDPARARRLSITVGNLLADFSKHRVDDETISLLLRLAAATDLPAAVRDLFAGRRINRSEDRPALHTALRAPRASVLSVDGRDVIADVHAELDRFLAFADDVDSGRITGASGVPFDTVVNIGIGGSDLGPRLVVDAMDDVSTSRVRVEFVANVDERDLARVLRRCDPRSTLFLQVSKSFGTVETAMNAASARAWLAENSCPDPARHFAAVTANARAAIDQGTPAERVFGFRDWVGGRYSVWSAAGLAAAIRIGTPAFRELLAGAHAMDLHFRDADLPANLPVMLGLLDVWYANFFGSETLAVVPYDHRLRMLPAYLSQLIMESNGKSVDASGNPLRSATGQVVWGAEGTNAQHAFFQLLHQGTHLVPVDFLVYARPGGDAAHHRQLVANCFAQSAALMAGRENSADPQRHFPGNRPSTTLLYRDLDPHTLGMLLALYEHRVFVQAHVWGINPFDQWGVELGKELARSLAAGRDDVPDPSTAMLLERCRSMGEGDPGV